MTKTELILQIRFGIDQLKASNSTLAFEHVCRFFARARIAHNVIPATGPVQSYGDQGRDFETFHSYLSNSKLSQTCSVGFANSPIAFPCSLEKNPLRKKGKIDSDVKTIMESGTSVERIYFFSGEDISVGSRHKKQEEIKTFYNIDLEIIDAQALAEHLSDPDLFWIATQYLSIPNDFFPRKTEENWYQLSVDEYRNREINNTFIEFNDIKSALRYVYKDDLLKVDIPFWLQKLEPFISNPTVLRDLQRKAIYEKYVVKLMGQNDIGGLENIIRDYFSDLQDYTNPASLEDAEVLLTFVKKSKLIIGSYISDEEIKSFSKKLSSVLEKELKNNISGSKRCSYLEIQANIIFNDSSNGIDEITFNIEDYVKKLEEILPRLHNAPFFPLERLSQRLLGYLEIILEFEQDPLKIEEFLKKLEVHLAKRKSELSVGDGIRERALLYMKAGKVTTAITLLHQLKIKWFADEATRGVILTAMLLGDCYSMLKMEYASKYYSLIAADMAAAYSDNSNVLDLFPRAMKSAADSAYASGSWLHYLELMHLSLGLSHAIEKDFNLYQDTQIPTAVYYPALIKFFSEKTDSALYNLIESKLTEWDYVKADIDEAYEMIKTQKSKFTEENIQKSLYEEMLGIPFNDIGVVRTIKFNIYGSDWSIIFENTHAINSVAEQFVSMLQVFLVELADSELFLTKAEVLINLSIAKDEMPFFREQPSNKKNVWIVQMPIYSGSEIKVIDRYQLNYVAIITSILRGISLLPDNESKLIIKEKLSQGILTAVTFGQTYQKLYNTYISEEDFTISTRNKINNSFLLQNFKLKSNESLPWNNSLSPTYSKQKNLEIIDKRINYVKPFFKTLEKMKKDRDFMNVVNELRTDWLDWQLFLAFGNLTIRYKLDQLGIYETNFDDSLKYRQIYFEYSSKSETEWYMDIPVETFSKTSMQRYLENINTTTVLPSYGLEFHTLTPDTSAIKELLVKRFNFMEDGKDIIVF
jgi:hypothetical protein